MKKPKKFFIIFMGPPASGKGTQSAMLSKKTGLPVISTGDLCRTEIKNKTKMGKIIKQTVAGGGLVSTKLINRLLDQRFIKKDLKKGFILDGYPRNLNQFNYLRDKFNDFSVPAGVFLVFYIYVGDKEINNRLAGRRVCTCGQTYHLKYNKPKKNGVCDKCGRKLIKRKDDGPDVIARRLRLFHKENNLLLDFFEKKGILIKINGEQKIAKIYKDIAEFLKKAV